MAQKGTKTAQKRSQAAQKRKKAAQQRATAKPAKAQAQARTARRVVPTEERTGHHVLVSGFIILILATMFLAAVPESSLNEGTDTVREPITDATGLAQNWNLFAPNPRGSTLRLEARIAYADGSTDVWHPPTGDRFLGAYAGFRWRKWAGNVMNSDSRGQWGPAADYIGREHRRDGEYPEIVTLVKQRYVAPPAGSGEARDHDPEWDDNVFYRQGFRPDGTVTVTDFNPQESP